MLTLYSYFRSSAAYRVRIALNLKGLEYDQVAINLVKGEQSGADYHAINTQSLVPSLRLGNGTVLTQSGAMLEWLDETFTRPPLYPEKPLQKARHRALCNIIACDIHPLNNLRVLKYLQGELTISEQDKTAWYQHWIAKGFASIEAQLDDGPFAAGEQPGMVDVFLVPQVYNALRFEQDMSPYPKIQAAYRACSDLPAFQAAAPEAQPDANITA